MKRIILALLSLMTVAGVACADETRVYQTLPGTSIRDYSKPGMVIKENRDGSASGYQTLPGTSIRDFNEPGVKIERDRYSGDAKGYQTLPGTDIRDFSKPGFKVELDN